MKLNVGCGGKQNKPFQAGDTVKIDLVAGNVRANACALPFTESCFDEINAIHVLEHIPRKEHDSFYSEMYRVLKPGGVFYVEVPNLLEVCKLLIELGDLEEKDPDIKERIRCWTLSVYGKNRHVGDSHNWGFMPYLLGDDLRRNGFTEVAQQEEMVSNHYLMEPVILFRASK